MEAAIRLDVVSGVAAAVTVVVAVIGLWFAKESAQAEVVFFQAINGCPDHWMKARRAFLGERRADVV